VAPKKPGRAPQRAQGNPVARAAPPPELSAGDPPQDTDPKAQAEYFLKMLDAFAQQGTPEAKRIRSALIEAVSEYGAAADKEAAALILRARVAGLELGVTELLVRSTKKLRDRFTQESRKLGTGSKVGVTTRKAAEGFGLMVDGLEMLQRAAELSDPALRDRAHEVLARARVRMEELG